MIFFDPQVICNSLATTPAGILNQALLFHESFGYSGKYDSSLKIAFGLDDGLSSQYISYYLEDHVWGEGASTCGN